jgi:hypothetical protein
MTNRNRLIKIKPNTNKLTEFLYRMLYNIIKITD